MTITLGQSVSGQEILDAFRAAVAEQESPVLHCTLEETVEEDRNRVDSEGNPVVQKRAGLRVNRSALSWQRRYIGLFGAMTGRWFPDGRAELEPLSPTGRYSEFDIWVGYWQPCGGRMSAFVYHESPVGSRQYNQFHKEFMDSFLPSLTSRLERPRQYQQVAP